MTWLTAMEYLCQKLPRICSTCRNTSRSFPHSRLITGFATRLTRRVSLEDQELLTLPEHPSPPPVFSEIPVTRSLVLCVCFVNRCFSFVFFLLVIVLWLPLWYLQTLLTSNSSNKQGTTISFEADFVWIFSQS
jgi:hypothetical protein